MPQTVVLLAEDEAPIRELTTLILRRDRFVVLATSDATQALQVSRGIKFDLLLTDMQMGDGFDGLDLAARILDQCPQAKVLVMSGSPGSAEMAAENGYKFLPKPFTPALLRERVREALSTR